MGRRCFRSGSVSPRRVSLALPVLYDTPALAREALRELIYTQRARGVAAFRGGTLAGYLLAARLFPVPTNGQALFVRPRSAVVEQWGYAAEQPAAGETYREMYAATAAGWMRDGILSHSVDVSAADADAVAVWRSLGFGQYMVRGIRETGPVERGESDVGVAIHRAGEEDLDGVVSLVFANLRYHAGPPIFQAYFPETEEQVRSDERAQLAEPGNARWLVYRDREAIGIQSFRPWAERPGLRGRVVHLQHGFTREVERGGGVGLALLDRTMAWAREEGYERCTVNWLSANLLGARFWQRNGFLPVNERLMREVDERVTWARPER